ncbi:MAG: TM2 domain-containing protein [Gammaproteobacteria bacterium]
MPNATHSHSKVIGYILWIFGFMGAHRFYYGRPVSGTIWFFTLGLLGVGWIIDLFLIPGMNHVADRRYESGDKDYNVTWILLTFLGIFGAHRLYLGKWPTALLWLLTGGLFLLGYLYDYWTLNDQIDEANMLSAGRRASTAAPGRPPG